MSLTLRNFQKYVGISFRKVASFDLYFKQIYSLLIRDVLLSLPSTSSHRFDTSTSELCMHTGIGKGGNTYMSPLERARYFLVYSNQNSDIFKMSIAPTDITGNPYISKDVECAETLKYLQSAVDADVIKYMLHGYERDTISKRLWRVSRLVAAYMTRVFNPVGGEQEFANHVRNAKYGIDSHIDIYQGELYGMMVCIIFGLFESVYFSDTCPVNACFETYNGKSRGFVSLPSFGCFDESDSEDMLSDGTAERLTKELYDRQKTMSTGTIIRFSQFCGTHFGITSSHDNELVYGVGIQFAPESDVDSGSLPLFGSCLTPPLEPDKYFQMTMNEVSAEQSTSESTIQLNGILNVKNIRHKEVFNTFRVIPKELQPHTLTFYKTPNNRVILGPCGSYLLRLQHYHVTSRRAAGVHGVNNPYPDLAGDYKLNIHHQSETATSLIRLDSWSAHHSKMNVSIRDTLQQLTQFGNIPRVEVAAVAAIVDVEDTNEFPTPLLHTVRFAVAYIKQNTVCYDISHMVSLINFFWRGVSHRFHILLQCVCNTRLSACTYQQFNAVLLETSAMSKYFYNGLRMFSNVHAVGKFVGFQTDRPFLSLFPDIYHSQLWYHIYKEQALITLDYRICATFFESLSLSIDDLNKRPAHLAATRNRFDGRIDMKACNICFRIMTASEASRHFDGHPCRYSTCIARHSILLDSTEFENNYQRELQGLNDLQRRFVHDATTTDKVYFGNAQLQCHLLLTGKGGAGKSKTVRVALQALFKRFGERVVAVVSCTKLAATIVGGVTLCSFLGITNDELDKYGASFTMVIKYYQQLQLAGTEGCEQRKRSWTNICYYLQYLFIDEASLISARSLDCLSGLLYLIKNDGVVPIDMIGFGDFGGIRIILSGDFLQLPPILSDSSDPLDHRVYAFEAFSFNHSLRGFRSYYLSLTFRQKMGPFLDALNRLRVGDKTMLKDDLLVFNSICGRNVPKEDVSLARSAMEKLFDGHEVTDLKASGSLSYRTFTKIRSHWLSQLGRVGGNQTLEFYNHRNHGIGKLSADEMFAMTCTRRQQLDEREKVFTSSRSDVSAASTPPCLVICSERLEIQSLVEQSLLSKDKEPPFFFPAHIRDRTGISIPFNDSSNRLHQRVKEHINRSNNIEALSLISGVHMQVGLLVVFMTNNVDHWLGKNCIGRVIKIDCDLGTVCVQPLFLGNGISKPPVTVKRTDMKSFMFEGHLLSIATFPLKPAIGMTHMSIQGLQFEDNYPLLLNNERIGRTSFGTLYMFFSRHCDPSYICTLHPVCGDDYIVSCVAQQFDCSLCTVQDNRQSDKCNLSPISNVEGQLLGFISSPSMNLRYDPAPVDQISDEMLLSEYDRLFPI